MKSIKKALTVFIIAILIVVLWQVRQISISHVSSTEDMTGEADSESGSTGADDGNAGDITLTEGMEVTIVATGDNFMHESVIESGKQEDGTYNYDYIFEGIKEYLDSADVAVINQASVIGGNKLGVSGYPTFNAPEEICGAIKKAGFDVVLMASNRVNSMGTDAIKSCIDIWNEEAENISVLGIKKEESDPDYKVITVNGVKIAMLNYTYGVNTNLNPDETYMVNFLGAVNEATGEVSDNILSSKVISQIETASQAADFVIVFPCWGSEYEYVANNIQEQFAKQMVEAGADLIIGTHPHYLQQIEWIEGENGNKGLCYYSLGNLISSQNYTGAMLGGLAKVTLAIRDGQVVIDEEKTGLVPIVTQYTYSGTGDLADMVGVIPYSQYTDELAAEHGISERGGVNFKKSELQYILDTFIDKKYIME